jgi:CheY-like chemotaxis protein
LNNAVKYTKEGSVTFTVKREKDIPESKECELLFSVKDTGIGIREEDRERLFEKFERLDFANNSNVEGTGLGMSIVVRLLESMGSNIELISTYGAGSDFYFRLRQKVINHNNMGAYGEGRREQAKDSGEVVHYIAPDAYVLIVDDVILNLKVACSLLARLKLRMDTAESGMEAIELVQKNRYDVILMDHMMPKMDGIEATKKIRGLAEKTGDSYYREVPILALTANAMSGMREKFMEEGLQDFISKPVEGRELETTLLKWLPKDKVCRVQMQQTQENEAVEESNSTEETEWNLQIPGINMEEAKKYSPDYEMYLDTLETYLQAAPITSQRIDTYRKEENLSDYTITVHGLKSASKIIGAMELSETARQLEEHGHKGEAQAAWQGTDHLLEMLKDCAEEISKVLEPKEAGKALWGEELKEKLDELKTCAENFDMGGLMEWERENTGNTVQPEMEEQWNALLGAVREVAFSEILEQIETLMNIL